MSAEFLIFTNNAVVKRHDVGCKPNERLDSFEYHEVSKDCFRVNSKNAMYFQYVSELTEIHAAATCESRCGMVAQG